MGKNNRHLALGTFIKNVIIKLTFLPPLFLPLHLWKYLKNLESNTWPLEMHVNFHKIFAYRHHQLAEPGATGTVF